MVNKILGVVTVFFLSTVMVFSQDKQFSKEEINKMKAVAKSYYITFTKTVISLSKPNNPACDNKCKEIKINTTINRFTPKATVQTISATTLAINTWSVETYLRRIVKGYAAKETEITFEYLGFDSKAPTPITGQNGEIVGYKMKFWFRQTFCSKSKKDNKESNDKSEDDYEECDYADETDKSVEVIVKKVVSPEFGERWVVLLGNIGVKRDDVKNLKKKKKKKST